MKKEPLQIIKLLAVIGTICIILSLVCFCKKTENHTDDKSDVLFLQEALASANNMGTQYWQNGNTMTPRMPDLGNVRMLTVANQANTACVPIKEKVNEMLGYRRLLLAKRNKLNNK